MISGRVAAIAHKISNELQVIVGSVELGNWTDAMKHSKSICDLADSIQTLVVNEQKRLLGEATTATREGGLFLESVEDTVERVEKRAQKEKETERDNDP